jgi:hypothetical protein
MTGRITKRGGARLDQIAIVARADSPHDLSSVAWRTRAEGPSDSSDLGDRANAAFIEHRY